MAEEAEAKDVATAGTGEASGGNAAPQTKVDLDLDDAPFLKEEKKAEEKPTATSPEEETPPEQKEEEKKGGSKKKIIILAGGGLAVLLVILGVVWWFFLRTPPPPPPEPPKPEVITVPSKKVEEAPKEFIKEFEPFLIPHFDTVKGDRFLVCKFSILTHDALLGNEIDHKLLSLRDAIYYYLKSKSSQFLMEHRNASQIKKDLTTVFHEYLTHGTVDDILFESYLNE